MLSFLVIGEQVSLVMDNTSKLVYAEGVVCLATTKRGNDNTRRWCNFISNPRKVSAGDWGGCMASSGIISARAAMAFSTAFSSVSLNVSNTIFPTLPPPLCFAVIGGLPCQNGT